jgi:hypothetical protein
LFAASEALGAGARCFDDGGGVRLGVIGRSMLGGFEGLGRGVGVGGWWGGGRADLEGVSSSDGGVCGEVGNGDIWPGDREARWRSVGVHWHPEALGRRRERISITD